MRSAAAKVRDATTIPTVFALEELRSTIDGVGSGDSSKEGSGEVSNSSKKKGGDGLGLGSMSGGMGDCGVGVWRGSSSVGEGI